MHLTTKLGIANRAIGRSTGGVFCGSASTISPRCFGTLREARFAPHFPSHSAAATCRCFSVFFIAKRHFSMQHPVDPINPQKRLVVVGAGQMGTGIGITAAAVAGCEVLLVDSQREQVEKSRKFVRKWLDGQVAKSKMQPEDAEDIAQRLGFDEMNLEKGVEGNVISHLAKADFVIEAVVESLSAKEEIFSFLDKATPSSTVLATNTSSISITKVAAVTSQPSRVIGMHFMNPVPVMKVVEVVRGLATSQETLDMTLDLAFRMGKESALSLDRPGFVANRLLMPYINEAVFVLQESIASMEDIDKIMKLGTNVPMGPLALADFIGLDTCLSIMRVLHQEYADSKYRPAPLLTQYVDAGWLGRKAGRGFYRYAQTSEEEK